MNSEDAAPGRPQRHAGQKPKTRNKSAPFIALLLSVRKRSQAMGVMANVIRMAQKVAVITALVEGCSVRSTSRITGVSKGAHDALWHHAVQFRSRASDYSGDGGRY